MAGASALVRALVSWPSGGWICRRLALTSEGCQIALKGLFRLARAMRNDNSRNKVKSGRLLT